MKLSISVMFVALSVVAIGCTSMSVVAISANSKKIISDKISSLQSLPSIVNEVKAPELKNPTWLQQELDAEVAAREAAAQASRRASVSVGGVITYDVSTRGSITADLAEFKALANQTLNDSRGWTRLGVVFREVESGGSFTLVLSEASQVPSFSYICSVDWSCRIGRYVIINQNRWLYASDAWNGANGALRDYRHMVVNHETGHWLGHYDDNAHCAGGGQPAPVMQQQSISLLGCSFNPWPLSSEIWSDKL